MGSNVRVKRFLFNLIREASDNGDKAMVEKLYRMLQDIHKGKAWARREDDDIIRGRGRS